MDGTLGSWWAAHAFPAAHFLVHFNGFPLCIDKHYLEIRQMPTSALSLPSRSEDQTGLIPELADRHLTLCEAFDVTAAWAGSRT